MLLRADIASAPLKRILLNMGYRVKRGSVNTADLFTKFIKSVTAGVGVAGLMSVPVVV